MRPMLALLLPLLALARPAAAQDVAYLGDMEAWPVAVAPGDLGPAEIDLTGLVPADAGAVDLAGAMPRPEAAGVRLVGVGGPAEPRAPAAYGPFRVLDDAHAALIGITDTGSPEAFAALLRDHPGIAVLEMVACPGTEDDRANLRLGLMIRAHGITTYVPDRGYVGSGAVELFLAGVRRTAEPSAQFAVHAWEDESGREANEYAPGAPQHRAYLDYYAAIGMSAPEASAFYAMTNSVPFESARWLTRAELAQWVRLDGPMAALDLPVALQ